MLQLVKTKWTDYTNNKYEIKNNLFYLLKMPICNLLVINENIKTVQNTFVIILNNLLFNL